MRASSSGPAWPGKDAELAQRPPQTAPRNYPGSCSQREPKRPKGDDVRSANLRCVVCGALAVAANQEVQLARNRCNPSSTTIGSLRSKAFLNCPIPTLLLRPVPTRSLSGAPTGHPQFRSVRRIIATSATSALESFHIKRVSTICGRSLAASLAAVAASASRRRLPSAFLRSSGLLGGTAKRWRPARRGPLPFGITLYGRPGSTSSEDFLTSSSGRRGL
jgi:hypothetical protein